MCKCKKLLVVADELSGMVYDIKATQTDDSIQEILLGQSLYGVQLSVEHTIKQIKQAVSIEEVK